MAERKLVKRTNQFDQAIRTYGPWTLASKVWIQLPQDIFHLFLESPHALQCDRRMIRRDDSFLIGIYSDHKAAFSC